MIIGCLCRRDSKSIGFVQAGHLILSDKSFPDFLIGNENIRLLQPGQIEGFAGGRRRHRKLPKSRIHLLEHVVLPAPDKIEMNLIAEHQHLMFPANGSNAQQLFLRPHPTHRIVRVTQDEKFHLILHNFLLKILKINEIAAVLAAHQIRAYPFSSILQNDAAEGIIHWLVNQHGIARLRNCPDGICDSHAHARRLHMPFRPDFPVVVPFHPACHRLKEAIAGLGIRIAVDIIVRQLGKRVLHIRGGSKIHIRHPQRQHVLGISPLHCKIIFQAFCALSIYFFIKIQISFRHIFLSFTFPHFRTPVSDPL